MISDLNKSDLTKDLEVTKSLGGGCLIGVPIFLKNGERYGTLCGMDNKPFSFETEQIDLFITMSSLLTYVIQLDIAHSNIHQLSVPFVPISDTISILPVIGEVDDRRGELLMELSLKKSQELDLEYLIIDLSGVTKISPSVLAHLNNIVLALKLIGVVTILTGFRPDSAIGSITQSYTFKNFSTFSTVHQALSSIGVKLVPKK